MTARKRKHPSLSRYVRLIREMKAGGWSVDCVVEVALGSSGLAPAPADERPQILALYREAICERAAS